MNPNKKTINDYLWAGYTATGCYPEGRVFTLPVRLDHKPKYTVSEVSKIFAEMFNSMIQKLASWTRLCSIWGINYVDSDFLFRSRSDYREVLDTAII